jgi:hypothetical protein
MYLVHYIRAFPTILLTMTVGMFCMTVSIKFLLFGVGPSAMDWAGRVFMVGKLMMLGVQYFVIVAFYELREYLVESCRQRFNTMHVKYIRFSIIYSNLLWAAGMYACLLHLWSLPKYFNVYVVIEGIILSVWIWEWCGIAVPMSAARYWKGLFSKKIFEEKNNKRIRILRNEDR